MPIETFANDICLVTAAIGHSNLGASAAVMLVSRTPLEEGVFILECVYHAMMDALVLGSSSNYWARIPSMLPEEYEIHQRYRSSGAADVVGMTEEYIEYSQPKEGDDLSLQSLLEAHPEYTMEPPAWPSVLPPRTSKLFTFPVSKLKAATDRLAPTITSNHQRCPLHASLVLHPAWTAF